MVDVGLGWGHGIAITDKTETYPAAKPDKLEVKNPERTQDKNPKDATRDEDNLPED